MLDNYPPGAANDPRAPYNEPHQPEITFDVTVSETLSKATNVDSDEYYIEDDVVSIDSYNLYRVVEEQLYTPHELIEQCLFMAEELYEKYKGTFRGKELERIIESCKGWIVDDLTVIEE